MADSPFSNPEIHARITSEVSGIQSTCLECGGDLTSGDLDTKIVETMVEILDAHARVYLDHVDTSSRLTEYQNLLRRVGAALVEYAEQQGCLSDPFGEDHLRKMAENSEEFLNRKRVLEPAEWEAEIQKEVERIRYKVRPEALRWFEWKSQLRFRIDTRFEARYSYWAAEAIKRSQHQTMASTRPADRPVNEGPVENANGLTQPLTQPSEASEDFGHTGLPRASGNGPSRPSLAGLAGFGRSYAHDAYTEAYADFTEKSEDAFIAEFPPGKPCSEVRAHSATVRLSKGLTRLAEELFATFAAQIGAHSKEAIERSCAGQFVIESDSELTAKWHLAVIQESTKKLWQVVTSVWGSWLPRICIATAGAAFGERARTLEDPEYAILVTHRRRMTTALYSIAIRYSISADIIRDILDQDDVRRSIWVEALNQSVIEASPKPGSPARSFLEQTALAAQQGPGLPNRDDPDHILGDNQSLNEPVRGQPAKRPDWEEIEFSFVGEHDVEIRVGGKVKKLNYKEIKGFENRHNGKPNQQWTMLRLFGGFPDSTLPEDARNGKQWEAIRKTIERLSCALRNHFGITGDPFPYSKEIRSYRARIKVRLDEPDSSR